MLEITVFSDSFSPAHLPNQNEELSELLSNKIDDIYTDLIQNHQFAYHVGKFGTREEMLEYAINATQGNCHILNLKLQYLLAQKGINSTIIGLAEKYESFLNFKHHSALLIGDKIIFDPGSLIPSPMIIPDRNKSNTYSYPSYPGEQRTTTITRKDETTIQITTTRGQNTQKPFIIYLNVGNSLGLEDVLNLHNTHQNQVTDKQKNRIIPLYYKKQ